MQTRVLLDVHGPMVRAWYELVQLQSVRLEKRRGSARRADQVEAKSRAISALLQPLREPRAVGQAGQGSLSQDGEEDDEPAVGVGHVLDRGAIPRHGLASAAAVSTDPQVDLRLRLLPAAQQPDRDLRGQPEGSRDGGREPQRDVRETHGRIDGAQGRHDG